MPNRKQNNPIIDAIQKAATGPGYSKNLTQLEACDAMTDILDGNADEVQIAILFIALRMKREADDENAGIFQAILNNMQMQSVNVPQLIDIADPYDGHIRGLPMAAFLPAVIAACGVSALVHGLESIGPKYGITSHQILSSAGISVNASAADLATLLENPNIGWGYIDQQQYCPALYALLSLRNRMVKRSVLTTIETLCSPMRGQKTHLHMGYVHRNYPAVYSQLARQAGFDSASIVRGVEGGVIPTLQKSADCHFYNSPDKDLQVTTLEPTQFSIQQKARAVLAEETEKTLIEQTLSKGLAALNGQTGAAFDSLLYGAAIPLWRCGHSASIQDAINLVKKTLQSGKALTTFEALKQH